MAGPVTAALTTTSEPVVLRLRPGAQIVAEVADERGAPIAGAMVELRDLSIVAATSDAEGKAILRGVAGGWHAHLDILEDVLRGLAPTGFWARHTRLEAEYDARLPR